MEGLKNLEGKIRLQKQQYLVEHIINEGYDADSFSEFVNQERPNGQNVDQWTLEELETMVILFKRALSNKPADVERAFFLEDLEILDDEAHVYAKRIKTKKQKATLLSKM